MIKNLLMKKTKAIYLHGLNSYPIPEKVSMLEEAGFEVYAPDLDFRNNSNLFHELKNDILEQDIRFLVGSSLGGYTAFWLAEDLGLPCLLFNPAMTYVDHDNEYVPEIEIGKCPARFVVIGAYDDVIDPQENLRFFRDVDYGDCYQRLIVCEWLGHQIDFQSFEELVAWATSSYRIFLRDRE